MDFPGNIEGAKLHARLMDSDELTQLVKHATVYSISVESLDELFVYVDGWLRRNEYFRRTILHPLPFSPSPLS